MKNKKIACYINTLEYGGAERVLSLIANEFHKKGYDISFITSYPCSNEYSLEHGIHRIYLDEAKTKDSRLIKNVKQVMKLRKVLKVNKIDFLITFMMEPNFRGVIACLLLKTKIITSIRNDPHREYPHKFLLILAQIMYMFSDGCVFQTIDAMECFNKIIQRKSTIILNPVSDSFFSESRNIEHVNNIVSIGRLEKQKNQKLLIESFAKVSSLFPKEKLLIYGQGTKDKELESSIKNLGMQDKIMLCGVTDNIKDVLSKAELFVLSSDYEGMPNALMEAIAMTVPVISTNCPCGGPKMLINDGENGFLVNVNDSKDLADRIRTLLDNKELQIKFSQANLKCRESFRIKNIIDKWQEFLHLKGL